MQFVRWWKAAAFALAVTVVAMPALAQKSGDILKMYSPDSPASLSIHEEADGISERVMMGVFNNLVIFDQHVPDLATGWSWNEDGTELTFPLRQGVTWHDGKPFTSKDVKLYMGPADRQVERTAPHQSSQILVSQPRSGQHERRL